VLFEGDTLLCEPLTQPLRHCRRAIACELSTIVGQEQRLISRPDVRGSAPSHVLSDRLGRQRFNGDGAHTVSPPFGSFFGLDDEFAAVLEPKRRG
jgi:hypothetical protein